MADVAQDSGLGKASLFHHFPTKAHLYTAVIASVLEDLDRALTGALAEGGQPAERLDRWIATAIDTLVARPTAPRLLMRVLFEEDEIPPGIPEGQKASDTVFHIGTLALRLLREGMERGDFRAANPAHVLQAIIGATVHPLATGRFGEALVGGPLFAPDEVRARKESIKALVRDGILSHFPSTRAEEARPRRPSRG